MAKTVTIKPRKDSKKFYREAAQYQRVVGPDGMDTGEVRNAGAFKGERIPNTKQFFRPYFSKSMNKWVIGNLSEDELQEIVKSLRFTHINGPDKGRYIERADIHNVSDPFFNHPRLMVVAKEGELRLDKDQPMDRLMIEALKTQHEFGEPGKNSMLSSRVKYIISDRETDIKVKSVTRKQKQKAVEYFNNLTHKKKLIIATAMNLNVSDDIDPEVLDDVLFEKVEDGTTKLDGNVTPQSLFISLCEAHTEDINLKYLIGKARKAGLLRKNRADGWLLFGNPIGRSDINVEEYFKDPVNSEMLDRVTEALNLKE